MDGVSDVASHFTDGIPRFINLAKPVINHEGEHRVSKGNKYDNESGVGLHLEREAGWRETVAGVTSGDSLLNLAIAVAVKTAAAEARTARCRAMLFS